jgi:hypothetical protein
VINDIVRILARCPFLVSTGLMREKWEQLPSLVCSLNEYRQVWSETEYIYKILPYPVNLKQEGEKACSARKHVLVKHISSKRFSLQVSNFKFLQLFSDNMKPATPLPNERRFTRKSSESAIAVKTPRPSRRGFCKPRGKLPPLRYGQPFIPTLLSGAF